jgi:hypothetical protein
MIFGVLGIFLWLLQVFFWRWGHFLFYLQIAWWPKEGVDTAVHFMA